MMLRSIESVIPPSDANSSLDEAIEQIATLVGAMDEGLALRRALIERAIGAASNNDHKLEIRALARLLDRHSSECMARLELALNSLVRMT